MSEKRLPSAVSYINGELFALDQTRLPFEEKIIKLSDIEKVYDAIKTLKVRGAPVIGISAAFGLLAGLREYFSENITDFKKTLEKRSAYLNSSRPTAVNLAKALKRMEKIWINYSASCVTELFDILEKEAVAIYEEDANMCRQIGDYGKKLLKEGSRVLTHCNAGALAASVMGTALAPIYAAKEAGINVKVYADETRPLLQGARLTAWELQKSGVDVTLICDGMAAYVMSKGMVDIVIVGCDRVAANGDTANKIGTLGVAVAANRYGIPFYIACPSSTYDFETKTGDDIVIEEREPSEVTHALGVATAPDNIKVFNPAFDVTPAELITGFITDKGVITKPFEINLPNILKENL